MPIVVALGVGCFFILGIAVLRTNPHRLTNQAFAATFLLVGIWLACVLFVIEGHRGSWDPTPWHRANTAVAGFIPWAVWLTKESIVSRTRAWRAILRQSSPWLVLGAALCWLCYTDSFIESALHGYTRGPSYFIYHALGFSAYAILALQCLREFRRTTGIARTEMQFLGINFAFQGIVITCLMTIGSAAGLPILKDIAVCTVFFTLAITAWASTAHLIFNVKQVYLFIAHRACVVIVSVAAVFVLGHLFDWILSPSIAMALAIALCLSGSFWLERRSRRWFKLDDERELLALRGAIIDVAKTEMDLAGVVIKFERLLRDSWGTEYVSLLFESESAFESPRLRLAKNERFCSAVSTRGWVTPESLQRQSPTRERMQLDHFLKLHSIALIVAVPEGSPSPSLLIAFGIKSTGWPFTYPEIKKIRQAGELMDNILTRSRLTAQAALEAKTEHLAMLSRGLAHDLKNLLTPVASFLVYSEGRFPADSIEAEVHGAAQRSIRIMSEYVREARFFADQLTPRFERVALCMLFDGVREVVQARAAARNISLAFLPADDASAVVDRVLIQRLLANLVANAIDASAHGQTVTLSGEAADGHLRFQVKDQGCGIAPEHLGRIFEAYYTTKEFGDTVRGFGLGLTICQKIAALHDGEISVQSEPGKGSTFTVSLPARPAFAAVASDAAVAGGAGI